jgi:rhomboid protease GluP
MSLGGFNCPFCNFYNANDERACGRCERRLPPPMLAGLMRVLKLSELPATKILGAISVIVFGLQFADSGGVGGDLFRGMQQSTLLRFGAITTETAWSEPYRWLASCYVHMGVMHIGMNMLALADLGKQGEERVGSGLWAVSYVLTGIAGFFASALWYGRDPYITAGASGAVFGLMGVTLGERARRGDKAWREMLVRALVLSFVYYYIMHTNQAAHLGGLAVGLAIGYFATHRLTIKYPAGLALLAAGGVVLSLVCLVLPHLSPRWRARREHERMQQIEQRFDSSSDDD